MGKKKGILICLAAMCLLLLAAGCGEEGDIMAGLEGHKAVEMYRDGVWARRFESVAASGEGSENDSVKVAVTVDVKKDMTEEEMMEVVDYYTEKASRKYDTGGGIECLCYAVFFRVDTDEELFRIKCLNGKEAEPAKEDSSNFPLPGMRDERGGELP